MKKTVNACLFAILLPVVVLSSVSCGRGHRDKSLITFKGTTARATVSANPRSERDSFINNPFGFTILKNISDDYDSIGLVRKTWVDCPLRKENIADPAFCMIKTVEYDGLTVHVFSFDVLQSGTAEYLVHDDRVRLRNGLAVGSPKSEVTKLLGRPFRKEGDDWVWRSRDLHCFLVFSFGENRVSSIRWHESRDVTYKDVRVWETRH